MCPTSRCIPHPIYAGLPVLHQRHELLGASRCHYSGADRRVATAAFVIPSTGDLTAVGGTSFATPIFAGMLALINQKAGYTTGQGLINPTLYTLASNSSTYTSAFHDITSGNNYCTAGTNFNYCSSSGTTEGFSAGTGYDQVDRPRLGRPE